MLHQIATVIQCMSLFSHIIEDRINYVVKRSSQMQSSIHMSGVAVFTHPIISNPYPRLSVPSLDQAQDLVVVA